MITSQHCFVRCILNITACVCTQQRNTRKEEKGRLAEEEEDSEDCVHNCSVNWHYTASVSNTLTTATAHNTWTQSRKRWYSTVLTRLCMHTLRSAPVETCSEHLETPGNQDCLRRLWGRFENFQCVASFRCWNVSCWSNAASHSWLQMTRAACAGLAQRVGRCFAPLGNACLPWSLGNRYWGRTSSLWHTC